mgnify:CR=1 FL=1
MLFYVAKTIQVYLENTNQKLYSSKLVEFPKPELYVIYTGAKANIPKQIKLSETYFPNEEIGIDTTINIIYKEASDNGIIYEYIRFTEVYKEQLDIYQDTKVSVEKTVDICIKEGILKDYLSKRKVEVIDLLITLYDNDKLLEDFAEEHFELGHEEGMLKGLSQGREEGLNQGRKEGQNQGREEGIKESAIAFYQSGFDMTKISEILKIDLETLQNWIDETE